jgi:hypothetical protein
MYELWPTNLFVDTIYGTKQEVAWMSIAIERKSFSDDLSQVLTVIPETSVQEALLSTNNTDKRKRLLPRASMAYFVVFMALCHGRRYEEVFRIMSESQKAQFGPLELIELPATSSIVEARQRLGVKSMENLSKRVLQPLAIEGFTKGAFFKRWRLVSIDGIVQNVPDTPANAAYFPRPKSQYGDGAYPQIRCVALVECGTRAVINFATTKKKVKSEQAIAMQLLTKVESDWLLLADRLYCDGKKWRLATERGGKAIFRAKADILLPVMKRLSDGSYLSELAEGDRRKSSCKLHPVRVIEFRIKRRGKSEVVRLITNLNEKEATPRQVINLYKQRWEWETTGREFKEVLNGNATVLRSNTPELVEQEFIGMVLAHYTIKAFMHEAAIRKNIDMDRLSFKHSLFTVNRRVVQGGSFPAPDIFEALMREIVEVRNPPPDGRSNPRTVKTRKRKYDVLPHHKRRRGMFSKRQAKITMSLVKRNLQPQQAFRA